MQACAMHASGGRTHPALLLLAAAGATTTWTWPAGGSQLTIGRKGGDDQGHPCNWQHNEAAGATKETCMDQMQTASAAGGRMQCRAQSTRTLGGTATHGAPVNDQGSPKGQTRHKAGRDSREPGAKRQTQQACNGVRNL